MILRSRRGQVSQQVGYIIAVVVLVMAVMAHYLKKGMNLGSAYGVSPQMQRKIVRWRRQAELVVIGTISGIREKINEETQKAARDPAMSYLVLDVHVEQVLRGKPPGEKIQVYFGWFSPTGEADEFPAGLKQDYRTGERVKLFLDYDELYYGYYAPGAYYTMDPVE
jgi:hypothetical protein